MGHKFSIKCDVFSCGITFFHMLTGTYPWTKFQGNSIMALYKLTKTKPNYPNNSVVSDSFKFLIGKMIEHEEKNRFNIDQVLTELDKIKVEL